MKKPFLVHFFPYGQGFSLRQRNILRNNFIELGATVVDEFWEANYIVLCDAIRSISTVANKLHVPEEKLKKHLFDDNDNQTDILCVDLKWVNDCIAARSLSIPGRNYYNTSIYKRKRKRNDDNDNNSDANSNSNPKRHKFSRNKEVADQFKTLSKLHQAMPLLDSDQWKAYTFRIVAGRIENLDFLIDNDPVCQRRLRNIKGFGESVCNKIEECLVLGSIKRIQEFQNDDKRIRMQNLKEIWGVGRVRAIELMPRYQHIDDIRLALRENKLSLDRNQLVGVDCYEDIKSRFPRSEAEQIAETVRLAADKLFSGMEALIMGSYRRGKENCGDVDILLTHPIDPNFRNSFPSDALGRIVDELSKEGKIAFHLTHLTGMQLGLGCDDYQRASQNVPKEAWERTKINSGTATKCDSFYMGCLYSPVEPTKRRRIDIKLYPFRERAFAMLYFTGNGFFNRSIRTWADRMFNWKLSDHGLFRRDDGKTRVKEVSTEKEIFDLVEIVYREPQDRDSWDALEPIDRKFSSHDLELTEKEFNRERKHLWQD